MADEKVVDVPGPEVELIPDADPNPPPPAPIPNELKIKRDWYQTDSDVVINFMAKNLKKEEVNLEILSDIIKVRAKLPDGTDYNLDLHLLRPIKPENSGYKVLSTKIEARLRKLDASHWTALEAEKAKESEFKPGYPSSSKKKLDWGKVEKDIENEVKDEESDVNSLFAKIFNSGDDDTKKAMMKSMQESGGTVLSTNWDEVGKKKIECSPPDGMEFKKWE